ncbi:dnaJ protein homolog 1-like [Drosophila subpulchrella]|uniref:dnaJ protein homolog 1-like n=1 Tax=Drosophila subpulchrella TaxID=1486046 RepID=UPI0018A13CF8|nr:dnaJ protein homolog 1-like [Drosophila subpulchrella]
MFAHLALGKVKSLATDGNLPGSKWVGDFSISTGVDPYQQSSSTEAICSQTKNWNINRTMAKDFYKVLGLRRGVTNFEIRMTYRKLALRYHWHCDKNKYSQAAERFKQVAEAFEVLSDRKQRDLFDAVGEDGLRRAGHQFHGDPYATFAQFFGYRYASSETSDDDDDFPGASGSWSGLLPKNPPIEHELLVTLEDIAKGCTKRPTISQRRISSRGRATQHRKMLVVEIRAGWKAGTRITFPGEGDEMPNRRPGDVIFVLREKPHPIFRREGCDLHFTARITLKQALGGAQLEVPTLQGEPLHLSTMGEVIRQDSTRRFPGQGLPHQVIGSCRGDLVVNFCIEFPEAISETVISSL